MIREMWLKKFWERIMKKSRKEKGKKNMLSKVRLEKKCIKIPKKKRIEIEIYSKQVKEVVLN